MVYAAILVSFCTVVGGMSNSAAIFLTDIPFALSLRSALIMDGPSSAFGRPLTLPCAHALSNPAMVLSPSLTRSCLATAARISVCG